MSSVKRHEVLGQQRALVRQALRCPLLDRAGAVESALAGDDHPLADVAQHRVRRAAERTPRARAAGALAFLPDQLAASSRPRSCSQDPDDVRGQAAVRLAAEVGHVHRDPPAGLELAHAFGEHVASASRGTRGTRTARLRARAPPRTACRRSTAATSPRGRPNRRRSRSIRRASPWTNGSMTGSGAGTSSSSESQAGESGRRTPSRRGSPETDAEVRRRRPPSFLHAGSHRVLIESVAAGDRWDRTSPRRVPRRRFGACTASKPTSRESVDGQRGELGPRGRCCTPNAILRIAAREPGAPHSSRWLTTLITLPAGSRTKNLRMPHGSTVSG